MPLARASSTGRIAESARWAAPHPRPRPSGFTIVELLVALVVLMIGIWAMMRIFPRGFSAVEVSQQRTTAAQLAEAELARWRLHPESLPDAIVATDYQGNLIDATLINDSITLQSLLVYGEAAARIDGTEHYQRLVLPRGRVNVGTLDFFARPFIYAPLDLTPSIFDGALERTQPGASTSHPNWQPNSLYLPRTVKGERINIRALAINEQGIPFHLLSHAPLDILRQNDPTTPADDIYVDVYDAEPWEYHPGGLTGRQFSFDPTTGHLYFATADEPRQFKVDYTDPVTNLRVLGFPVSVPPASAGRPGAGTQGLPVLPGSPDNPIDPATFQVHQRLIEYNPLVGWTRSAYRLVGEESKITGEIQFDPDLQLDPREHDIRIVKVDYRVRDWGILVFDIQVPPDGVVRLPVRHLKGPAFSNPPRQVRPQPVDENIKTFHDWNDVEIEPTDPRSKWGYVVAVDRQTADVLVEHDGVAWPANPHERKRRFLVDYSAGILRFNYDPRDPDIAPWFNPNIDTPDRSGRTYRIFCRAQADWAVQLMVAARQYARSAEPHPDPRAIGPEVAQGGLTYSSDPSNPQQLYFPLSEAGQAVMVDYFAADGTYVSGEIHTIDPPNVTDLGLWACRLAEPLAKAPYQIISVRGISIRARAVWVGPGRQYTLQELTRAIDRDPPDRPRPDLNETWHQVIVSTYLTRTPI